MKQLETDIAIFGAGTAGLAAAIAAAERGAKVAVFEKASTTGGTANMGAGPLAIESRLQRSKNIMLTREEAFELFMEFTHWRVDARLVSNYLNKTADTIEWLEKMGVEFADAVAWFPGSYQTHHLVKPSVGQPGPKGAATMMKHMTDRALELGVRIYLETLVKKIIKEKGKIAGLMVEDRDGEPIQVQAKAVIIGTGGFGDNTEMIKKYTQYEWGKNLFSMRIPGMVGEGIRMAWEVGAGAEAMNIEMLCMVMPMETKPGEIPLPAAMAPGLGAFNQPNLVVNLSGERFLNEEVMRAYPFLGNAVARQKNGYAFVIFDGAIAKHYEEVGVDWISGMYPGKIENINNDVQHVIDAGSKNLFIADSLDELAQKTGINATNLKKTADEYNKACDTGRDEVFHKKARYLLSVRQPKFYAGKMIPAGYGSLGGIKINWKTEVVTKDQDVIPGLYAVGVDACSIYGDSYLYTLAGNTMGFSLNSGRMAGENAVEYIKSVV